MVQTEQDSDRSFLHPDYADIVANGERYQRELKSRPRLLEMLFGIATGARRGGLGGGQQPFSAPLPHSSPLIARRLPTFPPPRSDAFVDVHKFQGRDVTPQIPALMALLPTYGESAEDVAAFMESPPHEGGGAGSASAGY